MLLFVVHSNVQPNSYKLENIANFFTFLDDLGNSEQIHKAIFIVTAIPNSCGVEVQAQSLYLHNF